jgi:hypothetical protein
LKQPLSFLVPFLSITFTIDDIRKIYVGEGEEPMGLSVIPYLSFDGNCEEAINTYMKIFGGEIFYLSR